MEHPAMISSEKSEDVYWHTDIPSSQAEANGHLFLKNPSQNKLSLKMTDLYFVPA
jgi:hypothetical protein